MILWTLIALLVTAAPQRPALQARFIGNMAVSITDGTVTLISDFPYESGYSRYNTYDPSEIRSTTPETLVLITHRHRDHWEPQLFAKTTWKVAAPRDALDGVPAERIVWLTSPKVTFKSIEINTIVTPHARVEHHSYVVSWHGRRFYFSGDTESTDSIAAARNLDIAFLSPWIYKAALKAGITIDARRIVIYHHQDGEQVNECRANCSVPRQGESIRID